VPDVIPEAMPKSHEPIQVIDGDDDLPDDEERGPSLDEIFEDFDYSNGQLPVVYGGSIDPDPPDNGIREPEYYGTEFMFPEGEWPLVYEDRGYEGMGESRSHSTTEAILVAGLEAHFRQHMPSAFIVKNMNVYYSGVDRRSHVSPDVMAVDPPAPLPETLRSYRIGRTGPAPFLTVEVLSEQTCRTGDFGLKPKLYASMGVQEYLIVDVTGEFLPERLLLKKRAGDERWDDEYDTGEGVASSYGFRVMIEDDGQVRISDAMTGREYPRPNEANAIALERDEFLRLRKKDARARAKAEARVRELEAENARLRGESPKVD